MKLDNYHIDAMAMGVAVGVLLSSGPYPEVMRVLENDLTSEKATILLNGLFLYMEDWTSSNRLAFTSEELRSVPEQVLDYLEGNSSKLVEVRTNEDMKRVVRWALYPDERPVDFRGYDNITLSERVEQLARVIDQTEMQEKDLLNEVADRLKKMGA